MKRDGYTGTCTQTLTDTYTRDGRDRGERDGREEREASKRRSLRAYQPCWHTSQRQESHRRGTGLVSVLCTPAIQTEYGHTVCRQGGSLRQAHAARKC